MRPVVTANMPKPACELGYPDDQLKEILGRNLDAFWEYMRGQTMGVCEGRQYNHEAKTYEPTGCGPHGVVAYLADVQTFLAGRPPLD